MTQKEVSVTTADGVNVVFSVNVSSEDRGDYWAARIDVTGVTVYGMMEAFALNRVDFAMRSFAKHYAEGDSLKLIEYLEYHGVSCRVIYTD